ncbi:hypothetical protein ACSFBF_07145 [Variovorax sp. ZT5P49]|uniref:hypothetical protein n=1 Tax=Variovorax sp. ZT5P49 TaxID=3443733 RepID=UPI003F458CC1
MTIDEMIARPGFYEVTSPAMSAMGGYTVVEVEADGTVHQLTPAGARDGVLSREGWSPDVIVLRQVENVS